MDRSNLSPELGKYNLTKKGGEVSVSKKSLETVEVMAQRLIDLWNSLPEYYQKIGFTWYQDAHNFATDLAKVYGFSIWQTAQVIAVLSPQNPWDGAYRLDGTRFKDGNRLCAINVLKAFTSGGASEVKKLEGWGYAPDFIAKAIAVLQGKTLSWDTAPKTGAFAMLIANPTLLNVVVVDSHASRIATGNLGNRYHVVQKAAYNPLAQAYILAASTLGIPAYVLQAGTWQYAVDGNLYQVKNGKASN